MHARPSLRALTLLVLAAGVAPGADARPRPAGAPGCHAFVGADVIVAPGRVVEDATLIVRDGIVEAVGRDVRVPEDAQVWRLEGRTIWPGFLDPHVTLGRLAGQQPAKGARRGRRARAEAPAATPPVPAAPAGSKVGAENALVHPELDAADVLVLEAKALDSLRAQGFTAVLAVPDHGVLRGRGAVVALGDGPPGPLVITRDEAVQASFQTAPDDSDAYPSSVMGATALLRQSLLDAAWYRDARSAARGSALRPEADASLEALQPLVTPRSRGAAAAALDVECKDVLDALRAGRVAAEHGASFRLTSAGDDYRRLRDVAALGAPVVATVDFPRPPDAVDEDEWLDVPLRTLRHWDLAPDNPRFLHEAGVAVSLTTHRLGDVADFDDRVRESIRRGLDPDVALAMVTTHPATLLGVSDRLGTLEPGKLAHLVVAWGLPFEEGTEIREAWIDGRRHVVSRDPVGTAGKWAATFELAGTPYSRTLELKASKGSLTWTPVRAVSPAQPGKSSEERAKVTAISRRGDTVSFTLESKPLGWDLLEPVVFEARLEGDELVGSAADGTITLRATRLLGPDPARKPPPPEPARVVPAAEGPISEAATFLVTGVTAWTCAEDGVREGVDVLVRDGRIAAIGADLDAPRGAEVVDGRGRHLTPGLIDAHSHAAIVGGVNEGTNSCTAEVRIADVVNSETVDTYRQLAGGLTTAHLLHGSANCMGGQSQVVKLRWGATPEDMKFEGAWPGIKFALGENVKQSNWGEKYTTRFPQTRMGVEQFMRQKFTEAVDYRDRWAAWGGKRPSRAGLPPRRDLQLEALVEVLEGRRKVHCHSYRQDEILVMMRVAEEFGFRVGTFQHVLEGYKVADEIAEHGAAASCFTDWWAYKFEVVDAIPQAGALMHERGVLTSFNSDSTELARRMNLEAAKGVKWGGLPPEDALLFVTLQPARQLGVDGRVGSLEAGKDADLVLWSGPPLSPASAVEKTWVDGKLYFDREDDRRARERIEAERATLVARARAAKDEGGEGKGGGSEFKPAYWERSGGCMDGIEIEEHEP